MDVCSIWILGEVTPIWTPALMEFLQKFVPSHPSSEQEEPFVLVYQRSMRRSVSGGRDLILNEILKFSHLFKKIFEVLKCSFWLCFSEKDFKAMKFRNIYDSSVLYSGKSTKSGN